MEHRDLVLVLLKPLLVALGRDVHLLEGEPVAVGRDLGLGDVAQGADLLGVERQDGEATVAGAQAASGMMKMFSVILF